MSDSRGDFLTGLLVGGILGLAAGILFAPASGDETRDVIRHRAGETADRVRGSAQDVGDRLRDGMTRVRERAGTVRDELGRAAENMRDRLPVFRSDSDEAAATEVRLPDA
jgi:gas vesicle protein